jgi:superfamily II DNA or RNA helicase
MRITISNKIVLEDYSPGEALQVKNGLTLLNPKFDIATRMNLSLWGVPEKLKYYKEIADKLYVPAGILDSLVQTFPFAQVIDKRFMKNEPTGIKFTGSLRSYQTKALEEMKKHKNGVLVSPTGSGKTVILCAYLAEIGEPALVLVNTIELANQFRSALTKFTTLTDEEIGFLGDGKRSYKPITVALLQTITSMEPSSLGNIWSAVICDEVHISPAETYYEALSRINSTYKWGASATPQRSDGLDKVIFWVTGPLRHSISRASLGNAILTPTTYSVVTSYYFPLFDTSEYGLMINDLSENEERNKLILEELKKYPTQQCVLLCNRKSQVKYLKDNIPDAVMLTSDMKKKDRASVMAGLLQGTHRVIVSTFSLFSTGIDLPNLEILFICAPIKSVVKIKQAAGRLSRKGTLSNKQPIIVDFDDKRVELLHHQWYQRQKTLKAL